MKDSFHRTTLSQLYKEVYTLWKFIHTVVKYTFVPSVSPTYILYVVLPNTVICMQHKVVSLQWVSSPFQKRTGAEKGCEKEKNKLIFISFLPSPLVPVFPSFTHIHSLRKSLACMLKSKLWALFYGVYLHNSCPTHNNRKKAVSSSLLVCLRPYSYCLVLWQSHPIMHPQATM